MTDQVVNNGLANPRSQASNPTPVRTERQLSTEQIAHLTPEAAEAEREPAWSRFRETHSRKNWDYFELLNTRVAELTLETSNGEGGSEPSPVLAAHVAAIFLASLRSITTTAKSYWVPGCDNRVQITTGRSTERRSVLLPCTNVYS